MVYLRSIFKFRIYRYFAANGFPPVRNRLTPFPRPPRGFAPGGVVRLLGEKFSRKSVPVGIKPRTSRTRPALPVWSLRGYARGTQKAGGLGTIAAARCVSPGNFPLP
jgi:hypothetical protein